MSDRYIQIASFSKGLDTRRSKLLEQPGALVQVTNGHINAGGEVEQRMSFAKDATAFPATTFGFEATASGLVTFGSAVNPGALPTGVTYRRCDHPTGFKLGGVATTMTAVISSCNFNGNAFVVTSFDDGNVYCYYGNVTPMPLVGQIKRYGSVLANGLGAEQLGDLATDLGAILNTITGFSSTLNQDENGTLISGNLMMQTVTGIHAGFTPSVVSAAGELKVELIDQNSTGTIDVSATAGFYITGGGAGNTILVTAPATSGGTGTANLTGGTIAWGGNITSTVSAVVAAINARTTTTGYSAYIGIGHTDRVVVRAPASWGALANPFVLTVTQVGITTASATVPLSVSVTPNPVTVHPYKTSVVSAVVGGLTGAGSYVWSVIDYGGGASFTFSQNGPTCSLFPIKQNAIGTATMKLEVTDLSKNTKVSTTFVVNQTIT